MLLLSLITLFAGPLLLQWFSAAHPLARTLDRVMVAVLVGLVILLLVPEILEPLGGWAIGWLLAGYLLPTLLERMVRRAAQTLHLASVYFALLGLMLHAMLDGAGLAGSEIRSEPEFAAAIILHRFGVGLMLWLIIEPVFGKRAAWLTLAGIAAATIVGFEFSERLLPLAGESAIAALQGLIVGTIVHGVVHRGHVHRHPHEGR